MNGDWHQHQQEQKRLARAAAQRRTAQRAGRDGTQFLAIPIQVTRSAGWLRASHTARSLLITMATAPTKTGGMPLNGRLTASMSVLNGLGWRSEGTVRKAVKELMACGLLHQTRQSAFPNVSALYAVTWLVLGPSEGLDAAFVRAFERGAYNKPDKEATSPQRRRTAAATAALKAKVAARQRGYTTAPSDGALDPSEASVARRPDRPGPPSHGAMVADCAVAKPPCNGANLDIAICHGAAETLMGRMLAKSRPPTRHAAYAVARRAHRRSAA